MLRNRRLTVLFAAALLLAQALGVAHAFEHPVFAHADHDCVVCAHGQGLDDALVHDAGALDVTVAPATARVEATRAGASGNAIGYRSRAPPHLV